MGALQRVGQAYLALPNVQADPRYPQVRKAIEALPALIPDLGSDLGALLDRGINEGTDSAIAKDALAVVGEYRKQLSGAAKLRAFERFSKKYVNDLAVVGTLDGALGEIAENLQKTRNALHGWHAADRFRGDREMELHVGTNANQNRPQRQGKR